MVASGAEPLSSSKEALLGLGDVAIVEPPRPSILVTFDWTGAVVRVRSASEPLLDLGFRMPRPSGFEGS